MFDLLVVLVFLLAPAILGYRFGKYRAVLLPAASLAWAIAAYVHDPPTGILANKVLAELWILLSAVAVVVCASAVWLDRHRHRHAYR